MHDMHYEEVLELDPIGYVSSLLPLQGIVRFEFQRGIRKIGRAFLYSHISNEI